MCDAGSEPALDLLCLPWGTIGKLWPAERVVMGLRVCKVLRHELLEHVHQVTLIKSKGTAASDLALAKDLARFGEQNAVTLTWGDGRNHSCSSVLQAALSSTFPAALKSLHLKEVQESDIASLKDVLSESKNLTRIDLSESGVGDSMATLAQGFQACTKLQHVKLNATFLDNAAMRNLAPTLGRCSELAHVDLRLNNLGDGGAHSLADALAACTTMTCLDVSENNIGAEGTARLFAVLAKCTAMSSLRASGNVVGAAGAAMLARAVGGWESLTCLDLLGGQMYYEGFAHLAPALAHCKKLRQVALGANRIGDEGGVLLAGVVGEWEGLEELELKGNALGAGATTPIAILPCDL